MAGRAQQSRRRDWFAEQILAITLGLVVLFIGRSLLLELLVLVFALRLPAARRNHPVAARSKAGKDMLMPF